MNREQHKYIKKYLVTNDKYLLIKYKNPIKSQHTGMRNCI